MTQSKTLGERLAAPTPRFYKKIRNAGLVLAAASAALLAAPVALPAAVVQLAGYLAVAGSVATAVAQSVPGGRKKKAVRADTNQGGDTQPGDTQPGDVDNGNGQVLSGEAGADAGLSGRKVVRTDTNHGHTNSGVKKVNTRKTKSSG